MTLQLEKSLKRDLYYRTNGATGVPISFSSIIFLVTKNLNLKYALGLVQSIG